MEDASFWTKVFEVYGPMAMGWIAFIYIFIRFMSLNDKIMSAFLSDTQAKMEMKAAFDKLSTIVEKRQ